jgi:hypothetical protein
VKEARSILAQSQRAVQLAQAASRGARPKIVPRLLCVHCDLGDVPHLGWWKMRRRKPFIAAIVRCGAPGRCVVLWGRDAETGSTHCYG